MVRIYNYIYTYIHIYEHEAIQRPISENNNYRGAEAQVRLQTLHTQAADNPLELPLPFTEKVYRLLWYFLDLCKCIHT